MSVPANNIQKPVPFLSADLLTVSAARRPLLEDLTFSMARGEQWILTGEAGIGKSMLGKALCGLIFCRGDLRIQYDPERTTPKALFVDQWYHFRDHTGLSSGFYYQQRYNSQDAENAGTLLGDLVETTGATAPEAMNVLHALHVAHRADASLVQLSSGEHKKFQLARAFLSRPQLLVLDNPYVGLDTASCTNMESLLTDMVSSGTQVIIIGDTARIPEMITHIATLRRDGLDIVPKEAYQLIHDAGSGLPAEPAVIPAYMKAPETGVPASFREFVRMDGVHIRYEDKAVLNNIHWRVRKGEHWWVRGENGAGKSTLLSLVVGDNPQAYANPVYLFDRRRGSGESIWEIKRRIGYISPELHWYFDQQTTCADAIASGFFDTTGLYAGISPAQEDKVSAWLEAFGLGAYRFRRLHDLSLGNQRMTLLARALVKNPPVLVLDEPCQGLDDKQAERFVRVVDQLMESGERTLIYVTHRQEQLPSCIDHVLFLEAGRQTELQNTFYSNQTVQR